MTRKADRLLEKLARALKEASLPPEVFQRIRQALIWNGLTQDEKRDALLKVTEYDDRTFQRLAGYVTECLQATLPDEAVRVATQYFTFLDSSSSAVQAELPRSLEILRIMAGPSTLSFVSRIADRLGTDLCEERRLTPECHAVVAATLASVIQAVVPHGGVVLAHRGGTALEQSCARDRARHAGCCGKALERMLSPESAAPLVDLYIEKRADAGLSKMTVELLRWLGPASGEEAFCRLVEEPAASSRMLMLHLLTQLGRIGAEEARRRLSVERWEVVRDACLILGDLDDPDIPREMQGPLRHADGRVQQAAVAAILKCHAPGTLKALADALPTLEGGVAEKALEELSLRKDPATIDGLEKFIYLSKGTKPAALEKAVQALAVIPSERAAKVLGVVLSDPGHSPFVRRAAADRMLRSAQPEARRLLEAYVQVAPTDPIAVAVQRTLQRQASR